MGDAPTAPLFPSLILGQHLSLASITWHVVDARALDSANDFLGQDALDLTCVDAWHVALEALEPSHPASRRVGDADQAVEDLGGAVVDLLRVAGQFENILAVGAALGAELVKGAHDGADHAGAHVLLLVGRDEGARRHGDWCLVGLGEVRLGARCWGARLLGRRQLWGWNAGGGGADVCWWWCCW